MGLRDKLNNHIVRERIKLKSHSPGSEGPPETNRENQQRAPYTLTDLIWNIETATDEKSDNVDVILVASALYYICSIGGTLSVVLFMWSPGSTPVTWLSGEALVAVLTSMLLFLAVWPIAKLGGLWRQELPEEAWDDVIRLSERVGATTLIPLFGGMIGAWNVLSGLFRPLLIATFVLISMHMLIAQNETETRISERFQHMMSNMYVIPMWVSIGGFVILRQITEVPVGFFRWPVTITPIILITVFSYMWLGSNKDHLQIKKVNIKPIENKLLRRTLFLFQWCISLLHSLLLLFVTIEILDYYNLHEISSTGFLSRSFRTLEELFVVFPWPARLTLTGYILLIMFPTIILLVMWAHNLISEFLNRRSILKDADTVPSHQLGFTPEVPVFRNKLGRPGAMLVPIWLKGSSVIVFDRKTIEELDPPHLEALYYHEYYHLMKRHEWKIDILQVVGPFVGGINATLTYWFPSISERRADCYAAYRTDKSTISRAIVEVYSMREYHGIVDSTGNSKLNTDIDGGLPLEIGDSGDSNIEDFESTNWSQESSAQSDKGGFRRAYRETYHLMHKSILRGEEFTVTERIRLIENECHSDEFENS